jgi:release factor glutamine methyltransferase
LALDGGEDGLDFYRIIVKEAKNHLNPNGMLLFEIGYNQGEALKELMKDDFKNVRVIKDYGNNDRVVIGELL